ncbi:MAG: hypothetical protein J07HQW1_00259 [Haloquadratum walsbyi J07HQW1]|uniref:Uncharacterized protein n=1 Tax=Haloquadratum walsbyi J07HQW1 TaxID=1238424 RepID=U1PDR8_9EURY|nr:MAG: hypothetical protein J07HQW1_00259 [Haloquadratum walsbyi J07HQW1]
MLNLVFRITEWAAPGPALVFAGAQAVLVADRLVDIVVVQVDIHLRTVTARRPTSKLVQLLVTHERRNLRQTGMPQIVGASLVIWNICVLTSLLEAAVETLICHPIPLIRIVLVSCVVVTRDLTTPLACLLLRLQS